MDIHTREEIEIAVRECKEAILSGNNEEALRLLESINTTVINYCDEEI